VTYSPNEIMLYMLFELFRYQVLKHNLQYSDDELLMMIEDLRDYIDGGEVEGKPDEDRRNYFEYEDDEAIIPMKNAPLDTVDEIRYLPGMSDELYQAVKPFLTVYPGDYEKGEFYDKVNFNAAPMEVLYAIYRGTSYQAGEPALSEEDALKLAVETIQGGDTAGSTRASAKPTAASVNVRPYKRNIPQPCSGNSLCAGMIMPDKQAFRFYRIQSTAVTGDGLQTTITRVVKYDKQKNFLQAIYYLEE